MRHPLYELHGKIMAQLRNRLAGRPASGDAFQPGSHVLRMPLVVDSQVARRIDEIPSETTQSERRFLYRFFAAIWSGEQDVIEVGPFLGGTTRAIALGMLHNPQLSPNSRLYTYDRFCAYYDCGRLREIVRPLVDGGVLNKEWLNHGSGEFLNLFHAIHGSEDYSARVVATAAALPDRREDLGEASFISFPSELRTSAVFVDGCKSWFSTKYFMCQVSNHSHPGTHFIFQDYGWHTCFWISAFVKRMKDSFQLVGHVDSTYWFVQTATMRPEGIEMQFPDEPSKMRRSEFAALFDELIEEAFGRTDQFAVVKHTLQKAGALAYIGEKKEAKSIIANLRKQPMASRYDSLIEAALHSPTYTPEGRVLLD